MKSPHSLDYSRGPRIRWMEFFGTRNEVHEWMNRALSNQRSRVGVDPLSGVVWLSTHLGSVSSSLSVPSHLIVSLAHFFPPGQNPGGGGALAVEIY